MSFLYAVNYGNDFYDKNFLIKTMMFIVYIQHQYCYFSLTHITHCYKIDMGTGRTGQVDCIWTLEAISMFGGLCGQDFQLIFYILSLNIYVL